MHYDILAYAPVDPEADEPEFTSASQRMQYHARRAGWTDETEYGDTDGNFNQTFVFEDVKMVINWGPDGRSGQSNTLNHADIVVGDGEPVRVYN